MLVQPVSFKYQFARKGTNNPPTGKAFFINIAVTAAAIAPNPPRVSP